MGLHHGDLPDRGNYIAMKTLVLATENKKYKEDKNLHEAIVQYVTKSECQVHTCLRNWVSVISLRFSEKSGNQIWLEEVKRITKRMK